MTRSAGCESYRRGAAEIPEGDLRDEVMIVSIVEYSITYCALKLGEPPTRVMVRVRLGLRSKGLRAYMGNTRNEEYHTRILSDLACFVNTVTLNMYVFMPYIG